MIAASLLGQAAAAVLIALSASQGCPCHAHAEPPPPSVPVGPDGPVICDERSPLVWFCPVSVPIADCAPGLTQAFTTFDNMPTDLDACLVRDPAGIGRPLLYRIAHFEPPGMVGSGLGGFGWYARWLP